MLRRLIFKLVGMLVLHTKGRRGFAIFVGVTLGSNNRIYTTDWGSEPFLITIGNFVTIANGVKFITHDGAAGLMKDQKGRRYYFNRITIGNNVFLGLDSIIMPGVKIENNVIVAAGSVVTKSIPEGSIVAGVPAKIIGSFDELKEKMLMQYISEADMDFSIDFKSRITKVTSTDYKPFLEKL
ncbi:acyltransferase [Pedobacter ginsengisoli]|uniref:acyltransferase n=1 Tax=Pedobacter ginsengisoli TaxID=363852 RepID=UPI00254FCB97|nr:acyltransferase [Pedobacter ginsengisoli]